MRIHLSITAPKNTLPFDHQHLLVGTIHKWLGWNEEHGKVSLYSFSRLEGGKKTKAGLLFDNGISFFFSSHYPEQIQKLISGIQTDRTMFNDLEVREILMQKDHDLTGRELFFPGSPVFIKRKNGEKIDHILYDDPRAGSYLKETRSNRTIMELKSGNKSFWPRDSMFQSHHNGIEIRIQVQQAMNIKLIYQNTN